MRLRNKKTTNIQENRQIKPQENLKPRDFTIDSNVCSSQTLTERFVGVTKNKRGGGFHARIRNPVTKKREGLGSFKSAEEASMAYLAKKLEFEKIVNGKKGIQGVVCDQEIKKVVDQSDPSLENQDSLIETIDSRKKEVKGKKGILGVDSRKAGISKKKGNCNIFEGKIHGVNKTKAGNYGARIKHPISKKDIWLGTFKSAEEASMGYLNKKTELEKELQCKERIECKDNGIKKVNWPTFEGKIVRVKKRKSGKYGARIRHPKTKEDIWIGTFRTFEEASIAYLKKNSELDEDLQGNEVIECVVAENNGIERSTDQLGPILEEINHDPCLENQESSMEIEPMDSINGESGLTMEKLPISSNSESDSRMEDLPIQKNGESPEKDISSIVHSESGAKILLKTESGMPIMDSHGFLLGIWSWIDDLSLPVVDDDI